MSAEQTTALSIFDRIENPMSAIKEMGSFLAKSGMFGCSKEEQGQVIALACMCEKKNPIEILRTYHIIEGKLSMRADAMLAAFRARGGKVVWKQFDELAAIGIWSLDKVDTTIGFTIEDAKRAGVVKPGSAWQKYPDAMLRARCIAKAIRMICPEAVSGVYTPEEVADFSNEGPPQISEPKVAKAQKAEEPETIEVKATVVEEKKPAAPPAEKKQEPAPAAAAPAKTEEKKAENPLPTQQDMVAEAIRAAGKEAEVLAWFVKNSWIKEGQGFEALSSKDCERILSRPDPFLRAVAGGKAIASAK